jgi:N-acylneuraminate cytidylyltransferase
MTDVLALVPARGGSKGVARKNVRPLAGKPLIAHTIEHALASQRITRTIVSTDDDEIADVASAFGAEVPFRRPSEFAQDLSPDIDVFRHALEWLRDEEGYVPELVVHLRPTGPLRNVRRIDEAIELLLSRPDADSLRSVSWPSQTPYKMWREHEGLLEPLLDLPGVPEFYCLPRQTLPEVWWQNGYVDIVRSRVVLEEGRMCGERILAFVVDDPIVEIDYEDSLAKAERLIAEGRSAEDALPSGERRYPA